MRSPINWFGGKGAMVRKLHPLLETESHIYCEPFAGGASMLFSRNPLLSSVEVINDLDGDLYNFYCVLRSAELFPEFERLCNLTLYSRREYNAALDGIRMQLDANPVTRAWWFYVLARMSFGGRIGSFGTSVTETNKSMNSACSGWLSALKALPAIHARLQRVQIENADWRVILDRYDTADTLFYIDPPYVMSTRRSGGYKHEMMDQDHIDLIEKLKEVQGAVVLSGYNSGLYDSLVLSGWEKIEVEVPCSAVGRTRAAGLQGKGSCKEKRQYRTEVIWRNKLAQEKAMLNVSIDGGRFDLIAV